MASKLLDLYNARFRVVLLVVVLGLACLAWRNRFVQDDAFISFRYAQNFADGNGLVWNVGDRVEGYTNCLWTLAIGAALYLGLEAIRVSYGLGMLCFVLSLVFTYKVARLVLDSRDWALLTVILLGSNYSFSSYATGGMETQLQACLFVGAIYILLRAMAAGEWKLGWMAILSLVLAAAILTRPDSVVLGLVIVSAAVFFIVKQDIKRSAKVAQALALTLPAALVLGMWLIWKLSFYGTILPNTFYAKASSITPPGRGANYILVFLMVYWLIPFPFLAGALLPKLIAKRDAKMYVLLSLTVLWLFYVIKVGGDFMEFRLLVPVMPFIFLFVTKLVPAVVERKGVQIALVMLILGGSLMQGVRSDVARRYGESALNAYEIETIPQLYGHVKNANEDWCGIGKALGEAFGYSSDVKIGIFPAGAVPYYSRLPAVDMMGLNDKWVARHGEIIGTMPGHQRRCRMSYLVAQKVNVLVGHPIMVPMNEPMSYCVPRIDQYYFYGLREWGELPVGSKAIAIPVNERYKVVVLYIRENPVVDDAIVANGLEVFP